MDCSGKSSGAVQRVQAQRMARRLALACALLAVMTPVSEGSSSKAKYKTVLQLEGLGNCPDHPDLPNGFTEAEIVPVGKVRVGKGIVEFRQNYTKFTKAVAMIKRCADRNDPHCELFQNWRFGDESCNMLTMKNMIWTPLFRFDPPLGCPVKAASYHLNNVTVDLDRLKIINFPEKGFWKVSLMVDADKIPKIFCYYFEASFTKIRL